MTLSVTKLLTRVVPSENSSSSYARGIATDTLMQLGVCLAALIHDVDHVGVPNSRLLEEKPGMAAKYNNTSIAEKNSIDVAWELLMRPEYDALRRCIAPTDCILQEFKETIIHATLATDIMDKDLKLDRNARWAHAFSNEAGTSKEAQEHKVRIVLEHLIQASDVCHTMQHWHIFRKWNGRLFCEMYKAWCDGRAAKDPTEFWYKGEISFFDFYIVPLAKKLAECGVFGVSSDEYLSYAVKNREVRELLEMLVGYVLV